MGGHYTKFCDHCDNFDTKRCDTCDCSTSLAGRLIGKPSNYKPMGGEYKYG